MSKPATQEPTATEAKAEVPSLLPTEKTARTLTAEKAKVLLFGPPKIGKTTTAGGIDPEHTLFLATEAGHGALELYKIDVDSWSKFRAVGPELKEGKHDYSTVVIDTVDELYNHCSDAVCAGLGISYPGDLGYGRGWRAVNDEFRLRIGALCSLGLGVWFISHATDVEIKTRTGEITKTVPSLPSGGRKFLTGFVDFVFFATAIEDDDGERRIVHTQPSEKYEAGQRVPEGNDPLPDPLPLHSQAIRMAMGAAVAGKKNPGQEQLEVEEEAKAA